MATDPEAYAGILTPDQIALQIAYNAQWSNELQNFESSGMRFVGICYL